MTRSSNTSGWTLDQGLAAQYAAQAGLDPDLAAEAGEEVWDVLKSLRDATSETNPQRQAKLVRRIKTRLAKANLSRHGELVQHIEAKLLALQGRGGDTELAHLTPGEMIVPPQLQTPEVVRALQQAAHNAGIDMRRYTAGSPASSVNPETGLEEYSLYDLEQFDGGRNTPGQREIEEFFVFGQRPPPFSDYIPDYNIDNSTDIFGLGGSGGVSDGEEPNKDDDEDRREEITVIGKRPSEPPPVNYDWIDTNSGGAEYELAGLVPLIPDELIDPCARGVRLSCCELLGPPVEPDDIGTFEFPTREQLRGLTGFQLEFIAKKYQFGAGVLSVVGDTLPAGSAIKLLRGAFKKADIPKELSTSTVGALKSRLLDIERAYRAHLATRKKC
ncbi:MAG: hypothetical protein RIB43_17255 [Rhodospirillaceae bacterium]